MATKKVTVTVDNNVNDGMFYSTEFTEQLSAIATGDKFWIPSDNLFVVFGTEVGAGTANRRPVAERILAVRLDKENNPVGVSTLFLSQMAKKDAVTNKYVFKNNLTDAHRLGSRYFKKSLLEKILAVGVEKNYNGRVWDDKSKTWVKDENNEYVIDPKKSTFEFKFSGDTLSEDVLETAIDLLIEAYKNMKGVNVQVEEE
jgi:hypothetical protein